MKVALISANLGDFDNPVVHEPQSVPYDHHLFTDENFPPRFKAMTPRLQAKIPKCFGWQMVPGYDYYLWLDSSHRLSHKDSLKHFLDKCQGHDMVVVHHPKRHSVWEEWRYVRRGMHQSLFLQSRYENELLAEQYKEIEEDKDFKDDILLLGGIFMYKNTPKVQAALKEWWYHITRYEIMDQLSYAYVLKKAGLKLNILSDSRADYWFVEGQSHKHRRK